MPVNPQGRYAVRLSSMTIEPNARSIHLVVLAAVLVLLTACSSQGPQRGTGATAASTSTTSGNPDELAGDALQALADGNSQRALAAIARANLVAPKRPDLAWLHARICMLAPGCEPEPVETRLRKLAPDNGVVWLGPLARAQSRHDRRVEDQILEAMSRAQRFDLYWTGLVWRLSTARNARAPAPGTPEARAATVDPRAGQDDGGTIERRRAGIQTAEHCVRARSHAGPRYAHAVRAHRASHAA